jgi:RNA polymerase sigma factor (sigma-70 family)
MPEPSDPSAELLRLWQENEDPDALNALLQTEVGILKHMIRGRFASGLSGSASASDIAQEAVLGLLKTRKPPRFAEPKALRGYLWRSAWHLLANRFSRKSGGPARLELDALPGFERFLRHAPGLQAIDREERRMALELAMNLLSKSDRELIRLVYFEEKDVVTAAAAIGVSRNVANSRLVRARRLLATRLSEWTEIIG